MISDTPNFWLPKRCVVIGARGGLGGAFVSQLLQRENVETVYGFSRKTDDAVQSKKFVLGALDFTVPDSIVEAVKLVEAGGPVDLVIVATGLLHDGADFKPEKGLRDLDSERLMKNFQINTIGPALVAKAFLPLLKRDEKTVFAALSARVGSISDNRIGGWYGYRSAKAALNQMLKTASIEHKRRWPKSIIVGLHPGTVDTSLSQPFQRNVADGKLFTPDYSASSMLSVLDRLTPEQSGGVFAYDGSSVPA